MLAAVGVPGCTPDSGQQHIMHSSTAHGTMVIAMYRILENEMDSHSCCGRAAVALRGGCNE